MPHLLAYLLVYGGFFVALVGIVVGTVVVLHFHQKRQSTQSVRVHILAMFATGLLAGFLGMYGGFWDFCSLPSAGAQCGLGGMFVAGPIAIGVGTLAYAGAYAIWDFRLP